MKYSIGKKYDEFISLRQTEKLFFDGKSAEIILLKKNLTEDFIKQIENDEVFFQIFLKEGVIFLLIKFDTLNWIDIPFVAQTIIGKPALPSYTNHGYACHIILADAMSGKVRVNRLEAFSHGLSKALFWAAKEQIENPPQNIERKINKVHACFSSAEMARLSLGSNK